MFQLAHSQIAQSTHGFNYSYFEGANTNYTIFNNKFIDVGSLAPNTMSSYPSIEETKIEYNVENCGIVTMFCPTTTAGRAFIDNENGIFIKYPQPYVEENTYDINSNDRVQYILSISDDIVEPNYTLELGIDPFQDHETQEYLNSTINDYRDNKNFKIIDAGKYNVYRLDLTKNEKYMSGTEEYMRDTARLYPIMFNALEEMRCELPMEVDKYEKHLDYMDEKRKQQNACKHEYTESTSRNGEIKHCRRCQCFHVGSTD